MRINVFVAKATGISRRSADRLITEGKVNVDGRPAPLGSEVDSSSLVILNGREITLRPTQIVVLNKPAGYVVSRKGQGSRTVYDLLPARFKSLKPIGRLDKNSTGLLIMTNDGSVTQRLSHPKYGKRKEYAVTLDRPLKPEDSLKISRGVELDDGLSQLELLNFSTSRQSMNVKMSEGRNRQIRRTFSSLGYKVIKLHRTSFGRIMLDDLPEGKWRELKIDDRIEY